LLLPSPSEVFSARPPLPGQFFDFQTPHRVLKHVQRASPVRRKRNKPLNGEIQFPPTRTHAIHAGSVKLRVSGARRADANTACLRYDVGACELRSAISGAYLARSRRVGDVDVCVLLPLFPTCSFPSARTGAFGHTLHEPMTDLVALVARLVALMACLVDARRNHVDTVATVDVTVLPVSCCYVTRPRHIRRPPHAQGKTCAHCITDPCVRLRAFFCPLRPCPWMRWCDASVRFSDPTRQSVRTRRPSVKPRRRRNRDYALNGVHVPPRCPRPTQDVDVGIQTQNEDAWVFFSPVLFLFLSFFSLAVPSSLGGAYPYLRRRTRACHSCVGPRRRSAGWPSVRLRLRASSVRLSVALGIGVGV
ncbi:hypothetical protein C8F04DRAFT_1332022, partial [Mycena alexandri]